MPALSLNGNDTISINGQLLTKFFDKDYGMVTLPNELANFKVGKSGNTAINFISMGVLGELTLRILVGTSDDQFINALLLPWITDAPSFVTLTGQVIKRSGDGQGNVRNIVYAMRGGVPVQIPEEHSNADGDEEQAAAVWKFKFAQVARQIL